MTANANRLENTCFPLSFSVFFFVVVTCVSLNTERKSLVAGISSYFFFIPNKLQNQCGSKGLKLNVSFFISRWFVNTYRRKCFAVGQPAKFNSENVADALIVFEHIEWLGWWWPRDYRGRWTQQPGKAIGQRITKSKWFNAIETKEEDANGFLTSTSFSIGVHIWFKKVTIICFAIFRYFSLFSAIIRNFANFVKVKN